MLKLLEQIREFSDQLSEENRDQATKSEHDGEPDHPSAAVGALMKLSFDEEHRHAICQLGKAVRSGLSNCALHESENDAFSHNPNQSFCYSKSPNALSAL